MLTTTAMTITANNTDRPNVSRFNEAAQTADAKKCRWSSGGGFSDALVHAKQPHIVYRARINLIFMKIANKHAIRMAQTLLTIKPFQYAENQNQRHKGARCWREMVARLAWQARRLKVNCTPFVCPPLPLNLSFTVAHFLCFTLKISAERWHDLTSRATFPAKFIKSQA